MKKGDIKYVVFVNYDDNKNEDNTEVLPVTIIKRDSLYKNMYQVETPKKEKIYCDKEEIFDSEVEAWQLYDEIKKNPLSKYVKEI